MTSAGRLFHTFATATGRARPPTVDRWKNGTGGGGPEPMSVWRVGVTCQGRR